MPTGDTLIDWLRTLESLLPVIVVVLAVVFVAAMATMLALSLLDFRRLLRQKFIFLELTPPASTDKTPEATQRLFAVLHGLEAARSFLDKLLRRKVAFSLEVVSTRKQGIRYMLRVPESDVSAFEQALIAYLPDAKLRRVEDYLPKAMNHRQASVLAFKQTGHFAYPLQTQADLEQHDPIAYLNGAMTQLLPDELIAFQIVASPVKVREAIIIQHRLMHNEALVSQLGRRQLPAGKLLGIINTLLFGILDAIGDIVSGPSRGYNPERQAAMHRREAAAKLKPARQLSAIEQELASAVHDKLSQPLFRVDIRAMVVMGDKQRRKQRLAGIRNSLSAFTTPKYQSLSARFSSPQWLKGRWRVFALQHRLPSMLARNTTLLSAAEVAGVYHFPHSQTDKTENVAKSLSKTLAAPVSLKNGTAFDVVLGRNHHHGTATDIGLTAADRERHVYIIGGTGNGKTTLLQYAIVQDIHNGKGVAVIDPHGDMAETLLRHIPEERLNDVVYFSPDDLAHPIGLNVLELTPGLTGDKLLREKDLVTESVISIFRKIFSDDDTGGHRIEYVLRNAIQTALTIENATLFTVYNLLNDPAYCKKIVAGLDNDDLKNFWKNELGKAGGFQQVKMVAGITAKIGRFLFSASAKRILEQPKSTINFDEILDGKILICNFSKGLLGEDTSELFGVSVLAKIQMAALRRAMSTSPNPKHPVSSHHTPASVAA